MSHAYVQPNGQYWTYSGLHRSRLLVTEPAMTTSISIYRACAVPPEHRSRSAAMMSTGAWISARGILTAQPSSSTLNASSVPSSRIRFTSKICQAKRVLTTTTGESNLIVVRRYYPQIDALSILSLLFFVNSNLYYRYSFVYFYFTSSH